MRIARFAVGHEIEVRQRLTDSEFDGYVQKGWPPGQLVALITKLAR